MSGGILAVDSISKRFGGLAALDRVTTTVRRGEIKAVIGPNGAGKTTLFNVISGLERADAGRILWGGRDIAGTRPERIARLGIARTFQTTQLFLHLNLVENVLLGRYARTRVSFAGAGFWLPRAYREEHAHQEKAYEILSFLGLYDKASRKIPQLSHLERKLAEMGRALAMEPELLLLDEPFGGLNADEIRGMSGRIETLRDRGLTVVLIDHHMEPLFAISDSVLVLHHGALVREGGADEVLRDPAVGEVYLSGGAV